MCIKQSEIDTDLKAKFLVTQVELNNERQYHHFFKLVPNDVQAAVWRIIKEETLSETWNIFFNIFI